MSYKSRKLILNLPVIALIIAIFFFSNTSQIPSILEFNIWDKFKHGAAFFLLGIFTQFHFFSLEVKPAKKWIAIYSIVFASLYGASDELHQFFIPGRMVEFGDWVADTIGAVFSIFFLNFAEKISNNFLNTFDR